MDNQEHHTLEDLKEIKVDPKTEKYRRIINIISIIAAIVLIGLTVLAFKKGYFVDQNKFANLLSSFGIFAPFVFIIIQTLFTVVPINPSGITNLSVVLAYGPLIGFLLNYIAIMIGSVINFKLGRKYGKKFIGLFFKDEDINKQIDWLNRNNIERMYIFVLLVPFLPDDISCMICGMTDFKFKRFFWITAIIKVYAISLILYIMQFGYESLYKLIF